MEFSLDTSTAPAPPQMWSLDTANQAGTPLSPQIASYRSNRIQFGGALSNMDYPQTYNGLIRGQEEQMRINAASNVDMQRRLARERFIGDVAKAYGGPLPEGTLNQIADRFKSLGDPTDPNSVFEESFARQFLQGLRQTQQRMPGTFLDDADREIPTQTTNLIQRSSALVAKREYAMKELQDTLNTMENQSTLGHAVDWLKELAPTYQDIKLRGNVPGVSFGSQGFATGENLEAQAKALWRMPYDQFKTELTRIMTQLRKDNPQLAVKFMSAMMGQSSMERAFNNLIPFFDITNLAGTGSIAKGVRDKLILHNQVRTATKDIVEAVTRVNTRDDLRTVLPEAAGDVVEAAVQKATSNLIREVRGDQDMFQRAMTDLTTNFKLRVGEIRDKPGNLSRDQVLRIEQDTFKFHDQIVKVMENSIMAERLPAIVGTEAGIRAAQQLGRDAYKHLDNAVLDVRGPYKNPANTGYYTVLDIGKTDGSLFFNKEQAQNFAKVHGILSGRAVPPGPADHQVGLGYVIRVAHPLNETDASLRSILLTTPQSKTPNSWAGALGNIIGRVRTSEEVLSLDHSMNRKLATYEASNLQKIFKEEAKIIAALKPGVRGLVDKDARRIHNEWKSAVAFSQQAKHPATGETGYFFRSATELKDHYQRFFRRDPSEREVYAYFALVRLHEAENFLQNLKVFKEKVRQGVQSHRYWTQDFNGKRLYSPTFDGVVEKEFPKGDVTVLYVRPNANGGVKEDLLLGSQKPKLVKQAKEEVAAGKARVIRLTDAADQPLGKFSKTAAGQRIEVIITPNVESNQISMVQRQMGGPKMTRDYDFYVGQARVTKQNFAGQTISHYDGDNHLMGHNSGKISRDFAEHMNKIRMMIKAEDYAGAAGYVRMHMPMSWKDLDAWFTSGKFSLDEPFHAMPRNKNIIDLDNNIFTRNPDLRDNTRRFGSNLQERDTQELFTIRDIGTRKNPIYQVEAGEFLDPVTAINRGLGRMVNSTFMDDYKIFAIEHWIQEALPHLRTRTTDPENEIRTSPFRFFNNPVYRDGVPREIQERLNTARFQIQQFLGMPNKFDTFLHEAAQSLSDALYSSIGPKAFKIEPWWRLTTMDDAASFIRSVTFHAKIGLFALPQIMVQAQTYANILALSPRAAGAGTAGAYLTRLARGNSNPSIMKALDEKASHLGFKPGEFKESFEIGQRTGFFNVGREHMYLDDFMNPKIFTSGLDKFLHFGDAFFRWGETAVRYGAWHTAYKEFRTANPTGRITETEIRGILQRADLLSVNMSRASSSAMHTGIFSIPTQFLSYQLRLAELFLGKRLDWKDRARMLGVYSALYGVPVGASLTGIPAADAIRQWGKENGYVVGDNWANSLFYDGIPSTLIGMSTGQWYNIGDRYGIQGFETLREAMRSDKGWWNIAGGAAFSTFAGTYERTDGFYKAMKSMFTLDQSTFPVTVNDFVDMFKEISSVNSTHRMIMAMNTGKWLSKNDMSLSDVEISGANAMFMTAFGLQPQKVSDSALVSWSLRDQDKVEKLAENAWIREMHRGVMATDAGNIEQATKYFTRAKAHLVMANYPQDKMGALMARFGSGRESLIERLDMSYFMKNVPTGQEKNRLDEFIRTLQQREKQRGNN